MNTKNKRNTGHPTKVIFIALINAGKGTVIQKLEDTFHLSVVSIGDICRNEVKRGSEIGRKIDEQSRLGLLAPDDIIIPLALEEISNASSPVILCDGFPRNTTQAKALLEADDNLVVIEIKISDNEAKKRSLNRQICPGCGAIYSKIGNHAPQKPDTCDKCNSQLVQRYDDTNPETVQTRIDVYYKDTYPVLDFFKSSGFEIHTVDGSDSAKAYAEIKELLDPLFKI